MTLAARATSLTSLLSLVGSLALARPSAAQTPATLPSETPDTLRPATGGFDYVRREAMIPMRDGVKLHTVILVPRGAHGAPILLTRTPYSADELTTHAQSSHLGPILAGYDNAVDVIVGGGYIRVVQDVRGKYGSEGDYVMNRPLHGPQNPTAVDHSTDTWDTIDWLVKHTPESNRKVGILGISYDGFLPLMALVNPHPALKVAVPMNPMVDGWMGDDWFHNGAFRQQNMSYIYEQEATRDNTARWYTSHFDDYDMFMQAGSAGELGRIRGLEQVGFWRKLLAHPSYDAFWKDQAVDKLLAGQPLKVPTMLVHSLWDAEDIYGAIAVYQALEPKDAANDMVFLVLGPWHHGGEIEDGSTLGALRFESNTSAYFQHRSCARSSTTTSRTTRPSPTWLPSPRTRPGPTPGGTSTPGPPASRRLSACSPARGSASPSPGARKRRSTNTSPIPPSPCPSARGPSSRSGTTTG
jgi:putative CocE/NonD family hydrolase